MVMQTKEDAMEIQERSHVVLVFFHDITSPFMLKVSAVCQQVQHSWWDAVSRFITEYSKCKWISAPPRRWHVWIWNNSFLNGRAITNGTPPVFYTIGWHIDACIFYIASCSKKQVNSITISLLKRSSMSIVSLKCWASANLDRTANAEQCHFQPSWWHCASLEETKLW